MVCESNECGNGCLHLLPQAAGYASNASEVLP